jgi:FAD:protein FMN transferase
MHKRAHRSACIGTAVQRSLLCSIMVMMQAALAAHADTPPPPTPVVKPSEQAKLIYTGEAMGTVVQVTFWTDDEPAAAQAAEAVFAEMKRLDGVMTTWTSTSEVSRVNAAAGGKPVAVSDETFRVIARAQDVAIKSHGVFDITVGAYKGLWKFDEDIDGVLPNPKDVQLRKKLVNYRDLILNPKKKTVQLRRKGMSITLGGIAKGYAVDQCVALLRNRGFVDFIVQAGGDMYVSGRKTDQPWVVGIRDPRGPREASFALAPIEDHSFSTSGDYERAFVKDGKRYHHILDPRTAQPATQSRSVTIMAKDAFTADAWSKVLFIEGWQAAIKLAASMPDFECVIVDDKNQVHVSKGLEKILKTIKPPTEGV